MEAIKIGGSILDKDLTKLFTCLDRNKKYLVIHGWSYQVNRYMDKNNIKAEFYISPLGFKSRKTSEETVKIIAKVSEDIRDLLIKQLKKSGFNAIGISGTNHLRGIKKTPRVFSDGVLKKIEDDFTGKIMDVNHKITDLFNECDVLVMTPLITGQKSEILSTDADLSVSVISSELGIERIINITNIGGYIEDGRIINELKIAELQEKIKKTGGGMKKKLLSAKLAVENGVKEIIICDEKFFSSRKRTIISQ